MHIEPTEAGNWMRAAALRAREASGVLARVGAAARNTGLRAAAVALRAQSAAIVAANARDLVAFDAAGGTAAFRDRLALTPERVEAMAQGLDDIARLPDPVGRVLASWERPNGLQFRRIATPIGVIGMIYESRPNVGADAAGLCLKSGNAVILRGGSEAVRSNQAIAECVQSGLRAAGLPADAVQLVGITDRAAVGELLRMREFVDIIIPRGGKSLIERIIAESQIPMIKHLDGICHVYIDRAADPDKAIRIADNAKTQRYGTCNTMETLLVDTAIAPSVLPSLAAIYQGKGVELRGDAAARALVPGMLAATEADWGTEYLAPILAVRIVEGIDEAIDHIARYGSAHTDAIVTEDRARAERFLREVDSSSVMVNASTRFADGFEYGLGAEIGISTDKLHARGPVGLEGLTSQKFVVLGDGQVRS